MTGDETCSPVCRQFRMLPGQGAVTMDTNSDRQ